MKRLALAVLVALAWALPADAQPVPPGGLRKVTHDTSLTGLGTSGTPLGLVHCISNGQALIWNSGSSVWECGSAGGTVTTVDTLAPLQGGPITSTGTVSLSLCAAGEVLKTNVGATAWECAADSGGISNSAGANVVMKSDGTNAVASSIHDDASAVTTSEPIWSSLNNNSGGAVHVGTDVNSVVGTAAGFDVITNGNVFISSKATTGNSTIFRTGAGTSNGYTNTWLTVDGTGATTFAKAMTIGAGATWATFGASGTSLFGALDLNSHQIHNVTDGTSAQDAATVAQLTAATTNEVTGTLTALTLPIATGAHTVGDSLIRQDSAGAMFIQAGASTKSINIGTTLAQNINLGKTGTPTNVKDDLVVTGAATVGTTLGVTGAATLSSTLGVTGNTTLGSTTANVVAAHGSFAVNTDDISVNPTTHQVYTSGEVTSGTLTSRGSLGVSADSTLGGASTNVTKVEGRLEVNTSAATVSACGTSVVLHNGNANSGYITTGTSASTCTINLGATFTNAPNCTVSEVATTGTVDTSLYISSTSTTQLSFHYGGTAIGVMYVCMGR